MSEIDWELIEDKLENVKDALTTIEERFSQVPNADFFRTKTGREKSDGICMLFIAIGESLKQIDELSNRTFLSRYPKVDWKKIIGFRNIVAHNYFNIDEDVLFNNCSTHLSPLLETVNRMINELEKNHAS